MENHKLAFLFNFFIVFLFSSFNAYALDWSPSGQTDANGNYIVTEEDKANYRRDTPNWGGNLIRNKETLAKLRAIEAAVNQEDSIKSFQVSNASLLKVFADPIQQLKDAAQKYTKGLTEVATSLFWILVAISGAFQFAFMVLKRSDLSEYFSEVVKFTITIGFFYWLLLNGSTIALAIFDGLSVNVALKVANISADPVYIVQSGLKILGVAADPTGVSFKAPETIVIYLLKILAGIVALFALVVLAVNYAILKAAGYLVLCLGVIVLGFGGASYTRDWTLTYFRSAISLGIRLLTMTMILAVGVALIMKLTEESLSLGAATAGAINNIGNASDVGDVVTAAAAAAGSKFTSFLNVIMILIAVVLLYMCAKTVPDIVASFIGNAGAAPQGASMTSGAIIAAAAAPVAGAMTMGAAMSAASAGGMTGKQMMSSLGNAILSAASKGSMKGFASSFSDSIGKQLDAKDKASGKNLSGLEKMQFEMNQLNGDSK